MYESHERVGEDDDVEDNLQSLENTMKDYEVSSVSYGSGEKRIGGYQETREQSCLSANCWA